MKTNLKALLLSAVLAVTPMSMAVASGDAHYPKAPIDLRDQASLQRGAQIFMNYCISCHSAATLRYNRLTDIGLSEEQIKNNLIFTDAKVGDLVKAAMPANDAKEWFGVTPPDLSLIARSRGADYLYAYMRGFYQDPSRPSGWNNTVFDKAAMPHILWEQGGYQAVDLDQNGQPVLDEHGQPKLHWVTGGLHTRVNGNDADTTEYDNYVRDLVNFMVWVGEPAQQSRKRIGYLVLMYLLVVMLPLTYFLKKEYWKDVEH